MAKKTTVMTPTQAQALIEKIRSSCDECSKMESAHDAGMATIEAFEEALGTDWQNTRIVVTR
ncbi:MAG: hypothetical protein ACRD6W_19685 [Nitrososphaerales archaeon]